MLFRLVLLCAFAGVLGGPLLPAPTLSATEKYTHGLFKWACLSGNGDALFAMGDSVFVSYDVLASSVVERGTAFINPAHSGELCEALQYDETQKQERPIVMGYFMSGASFHVYAFDVSSTMAVIPSIYSGLPTSDNPSLYIRTAQYVTPSYTYVYMCQDYWIFSFRLIPGSADSLSDMVNTMQIEGECTAMAVDPVGGVLLVGTQEDIRYFTLQSPGSPKKLTGVVSAMQAALYMTVSEGVLYAFGDDGTSVDMTVSSYDLSLQTKIGTCCSFSRSSMLLRSNEDLILFDETVNAQQIDITSRTPTRLTFPNWMTVGPMEMAMDVKGQRLFTYDGGSKDFRIYDIPRPPDPTVAPPTLPPPTVPPRIPFTSLPPTPLPTTTSPSTPAPITLPPPTLSPPTPSPPTRPPSTPLPSMPTPEPSSSSPPPSSAPSITSLPSPSSVSMVPSSTAVMEEEEDVRPKLDEVFPEEVEGRMHTTGVAFSTASLATAVYGGAGSIGSATRFVVSTSLCSAQSPHTVDYPWLLHPTQWRLMGLSSAGMVVGNLALCGAFWVFARIVVEIVSKVVGRDVDVDVDGMCRFPSAPFFVFQFFHLGICIGAMALVFDPPGMLETLLGFAGVVLCSGVNVFFLFKIMRGVPLEAHYMQDTTERSVAAEILVGSGEWVSRSEDRQWVRRYGSVLRAFRQEWACFMFADMAASMALAALVALPVDSNTGCGHRKTAISLLFFLMFCFEIWLVPRARIFEAYTESLTLLLQSGASLFTAAGYYIGDSTHWVFMCAVYLFTASAAVLATKIVCGAGVEVFKIYTGRVTRLQRMAWGVEEAVDAHLISQTSLTTDSDVWIDSHFGPGREVGGGGGGGGGVGGMSAMWESSLGGTAGRVAEKDVSINFLKEFPEMFPPQSVSSKDSRNSARKLLGGTGQFF